MESENVDPLVLGAGTLPAEQNCMNSASSGSGDCCGDEDLLVSPAFLSARAVRNPNLSTEDLESAEAEAFEWAKRVNRC